MEYVYQVYIGLTVVRVSVQTPLTLPFSLVNMKGAVKTLNTV